MILGRSNAIPNTANQCNHSQAYGPIFITGEALSIFVRKKTFQQRPKKLLI